MLSLYRLLPAFSTVIIAISGKAAEIDLVIVVICGGAHAYVIDVIALGLINQSFCTVEQLILELVNREMVYPLYAVLEIYAEFFKYG